jgi:hypothetical protein
VKEKSSSSFTHAKSFNIYLAGFFKDLLAIYNRSYAFELVIFISFYFYFILFLFYFILFHFIFLFFYLFLFLFFFSKKIHHYTRQLDNLNKSPVLLEFKFLFLRLLIDHEHFVPLNVPTIKPKFETTAFIKESFWYFYFIFYFIFYFNF